MNIYRFLSIVIFFLGVTCLPAQTWPTNLIHEGELFIDPECEEANCLNDFKQIIQSELTRLKEDCGLKLNVIVTNKDCQEIFYEKVEDPVVVFIGRGPQVPLPATPYSSDIWFVSEGNVDCIVMRPYAGEFIDYDPAFGWTGVTAPRQYFQYKLENEFAREYVDFSSKYACQILEFISYYVDFNGCGKTFGPYTGCLDPHEVNPLFVKQYTGENPELILKSEADISNSISLKHFKSSFCTDIQILITYSVANSLKEKPDYATLLPARIHKNEFLLITYGGNGTDSKIESIRISGAPPTELQDKCYPHTRFLSPEDINLLELYANNTQTKTGFHGDYPLFRAINKIHDLLTATVAPAPSNYVCDVSVSQNDITFLTPSNYFKSDQVVKGSELKYRFTNSSSFNPNNVVGNTSEGLHDFTGGLVPIDRDQLKNAIKHAESLGLNLDVYVSLSSVGSGYNQVGSFNAALT